MKIVLAADHGGFELKEKIKKYLIEKEYEVFDEGTFSSESVDYPDFVEKGIKKFFEINADCGFFFCGSGVGVSITANKFKGIRAALVWNEELGKLAREHNNANIICMGGRFIEFELARKIVEAYLNAEFQGGRHKRRIDKITKIENKNL